MFRLLTFGGLSLTNGDPHDEMGTRRLQLALLARLAVGGQQGISRDHLLALFWPESDEVRARASLKQAIYSIRRSLGSPNAILGTEQLRLNPAVITSDVAEFEAALRDVDPRRAVELYRGPFLDAIHIGNGEFESWRDAEAARLMARYRDALSSLAREAEQTNARSEALGWCRALERVDPLSASVAASVIRAFVANGDTSGAIRAGRAYIARVRSELEVEPDAHVLRLLEEIERTPAFGTPSASRDSEEDPSPSARDAVSPISGSDEALERVQSTKSTSASRHRMTAVTAAALGTSVLAASILFRGLSVDANAVRVLRTGVATDSAFMAQTFEVLAAADPTLAVTRWSWRRPRFVVAIDVLVEGDSLRLAVDVQDLERRTRSVIGPVVTSARTPEAALRDCAERLAVLILAHQDPLFISWSDSAALPRTVASFRELRAGIESWDGGNPREPARHFETAAQLDPTSGTPLTWKALALWVGERGPRADSAIARLDSTTRRMGPWDHLVMDIVRAWHVTDLQQSHAAGHRLIAMFPNSEWAVLPAYDALALGRAREAVTLARGVPRTLRWTAAWANTTEGQALDLLGDFASMQRLQLPCAAGEYQRACGQTLVRMLAGLGRINDVEQVCLSSMQVNTPDTPFPWEPCSQATIELWGHGHADAAYDLARKWIALIDESRSLTHDDKAVIHAEILTDIGRWSEAARDLATVRTARDTDVDYFATLALTQAARGDRKGVAATRARMTALGMDQDVGFRARLAALLGDKDEAFALLARLRRESPWWPTILHWTAAYGPLHADPRYQDLVRTRDEPEGLQQYATAHVAR